MVRAILAGRKTQTRRIVKPQPSYLIDTKCSSYTTSLVSRNGDLYPGPEAYGVYSEEEAWPCPYGQPGDRLWVRESFYCDTLPFADGGPLPKSKPDWADDNLYYRADGTCCQIIPECSCGEVGKPKFRPSIHMPRWASRITLEIVSVRVERLHAITEADAIAEGIERDAAEFKEEGKSLSRAEIEALIAAMKQSTGDKWDRPAGRLEQGGFMLT